MVRDRFLASSLTGVDGGTSVSAGLDRTSSGVPGLDPLVEGGFPANRAIVLCGATGTGKTTFGLQFIAEGLRNGEHVAFVCVDEKPRHLVHDAISLGLDLEGSMSKGQLTVLDAAPFFSATRSGAWTKSAADAREVSSDLVQQIRDVSARRLVIDSLTSLVPPDLAYGHVYNYLRALINSLEDNVGCSMILTCRRLRRDPQGITEAARSLATGIIDLRLSRRGDRLQRTMSVRKMRGREIDLADHRVSLTRGFGLCIEAPAPMERALARDLFKAV
jgi:KaiC/GvpD/RAD55 family RecA-like ATPase